MGKPLNSINTYLGPPGGRSLYKYDQDRESFSEVNLATTHLHKKPTSTHRKVTKYCIRGPQFDPIGNTKFSKRIYTIKILKESN